MEKKIYQVLGELSTKGYTITANQITVKETEKSYKVVDSKGTLCYWSLLPKDMVNEGTVTDRSYRNNFNNVRYEAYCLVENVDAVMNFMKSKIDEYHLNNVRTFEKVRESFKQPVLTVVKTK